MVELCLRSMTTQFSPYARPLLPNTHTIISPTHICSPHLAPPQSPPPIIQTTPQPSAAVPLSSELEVNPHPLSDASPIVALPTTVSPAVAPPTVALPTGKRKRQGEPEEENSSRKRKVEEGVEGEREVQKTGKRRGLEDGTREEMRKAEEERMELGEEEERREEMRETEEEKREETREAEEEIREEVRELEEEGREVFGEEWSDSDASGLEHFVADSPDDALDSLG